MSDDHNDEMLLELAQLNPVDDGVLDRLVPSPGYDALPTLIMMEEREHSGSPSRLVPKRPWNAGLLQGGLVARGVFVGAVVGVCALLVGLNLILSGQTRIDDQAVTDPAAATGGVVLDEADGSVEPAPSPGLPVASETPATTTPSGSDASAEEQVSETAQPEPSPSTDTTPPAPESTTPTTVDSEPCTAEAASLAEAAVAYRETCSEPRADCDPVAGSDGRWICSSEIMGTEGPSDTWGPGQNSELSDF